MLLEFTVEPFVEGLPGPHVSAAIEAAQQMGGAIEFGPFGSTCSAPNDTMPDVISALVRAAFAHGASHISMHVTHAEESPS
jgi:uncharacterized protein YqgV (UPF0045/DUF77 family)